MDTLIGQDPSRARIEKASSMDVDILGNCRRFEEQCGNEPCAGANCADYPLPVWTP